MHAATRLSSTKDIDLSSPAKAVCLRTSSEAESESTNEFRGEPKPKKRNQNIPIATVQEVRHPVYNPFPSPDR